MEKDHKAQLTEIFACVGGGFQAACDRLKKEFPEEKGLAVMCQEVAKTTQRYIDALRSKADPCVQVPGTSTWRYLDLETGEWGADCTPGY